MKNRVFLSLIAYAIIASFPYFSEGIEAKRVTTKIKAPADTKEEISEKFKTYPFKETEFEKICDKLTFMAYDKKTSASKETFFVDNGSDTALTALEIEISYYNLKNKPIHRRKLTIEQLFPSKETRKVDISSWDSQKSFHYVNSVPSPKGSTPYTVTFKVISFTKAN